MSGQQSGSGWRFCVRDNGIGIEQENLTKIFDPFFTTMRGRGGSGLGLNIIYNLVTGSLQGQITVESQVGVGTTFIVRFPRNPAASASAAPLINSSAEAQAVERLA